MSAQRTPSSKPKPENKKAMRRQIKMDARRADTPIVGIHLNNRSLANRLIADATTKGVSLTTWVRAILYDFSGTYPGLTQQTAETIKAVIRKK